MSGWYRPVICVTFRLSGAGLGVIYSAGSCAVYSVYWPRRSHGSGHGPADSLSFRTFVRIRIAVFLNFRCKTNMTHWWQTRKKHNQCQKSHCILATVRKRNSWRKMNPSDPSLTHYSQLISRLIASPTRTCVSRVITGIIQPDNSLQSSADNSPNNSDNWK